MHFHFTLLFVEVISKPIEVPEGQLRSKKAITSHWLSKPGIKSSSKLASDVAKVTHIEDLTFSPSKTYNS